jgi:hypothetical protein
VEGQADAADTEQRLLDHHLHSACGASPVVSGLDDVPALDAPRAGVTVSVPTTAAQALTWYAAERPALMSAARRLGMVGRDADIYCLTIALYQPLDVQGDWAVDLALGPGRCAQSPRGCPPRPR